MAAPHRLAAALGALAAALADTPWAVIGGVAVRARGGARRPSAIAAIVACEPAALARRLSAHGIAPRIPGAAAFAETSRVYLAHHAASGVAVDLVLGGTALEADAIGHAEPLAIGGARVPVARARELVILALVAGAPRDLDDATTLLAAHSAIDRAELRAQVAALAEAADAPRLRATLARVLEQVRVIHKLAPRGAR